MAYQYPPEIGKNTQPDKIPKRRGPKRLDLRLVQLPFFHETMGPKPMRKIKIRPMGAIILLKKEGPTVMRCPVIHSEREGNMVAHITQKAPTTKIILLSTKALSLEK